MKIFKKILVFLLCFAVIVFSLPFQKLNADTSNNLSIAEVYYEDHVNTLIVYARYDADVYQRWIWYDNPITKIATSEEDEFPHDRLIIIQWNPASYNTDYYDITYWWSSLARLNSDNIALYNSGYNAGLSASNQDAFQAGVDSVASTYAVGTDNYNRIFQAGVDSVLPGTTAYDNIFNAGRIAGRDEGVDNTGFYGMLRQVALYPVEIFRSGLDVDVFGVNIGGFLLGLGILAGVLFLIRKFTGGR